MVIYKSSYPPAPLPTEPFHETILSAIKKHADTGKNKTAFVSIYLDFNNKLLQISGDDKSLTISYQQLYDYTHSIATFLHTKGFGVRFFYFDICTSFPEGCCLCCSTQLLAIWSLFPWSFPSRRSHLWSKCPVHRL